MELWCPSVRGQSGSGSRLRVQWDAFLKPIPVSPRPPPFCADSLFVLLPGRSREEAFRIGAEIAAAVTAANPPPVLLKLEKVCCARWEACVLCWKASHGSVSAAPRLATSASEARCACTLCVAGALGCS